MKTTRSARSLLGYTITIGNHVVLGVAGLLATPAILEALGDERLGTFRAIVEWTSYFLLLEMGLHRALMPLLAQRLGIGDYRGVARLMAAGIRAYALVSIVMLLGWGLLIGFGPTLVPVHAELVRELRWAVGLSVVGILVMPLTPFWLLNEARQRSYSTSVFLTVSGLVTIGLSVLTARWNWGIPGQAAALLVGLVGFYVTITWIGTRAMPGTWSASPDPVDVRSLWALNGPTFLANGGSRVLLNSSNVILAYTLGPVLVTPFFLTARIFQIALSQLLVLGHVTWAPLAELQARGDMTAIRQRIPELLALASALGVMILGPLVVINARFVELWVGAQRYAGDSVTLALAVATWAITLVWTLGWVLDGTGYVTKRAGWSVADALLGIILSLLLVPWLGIAGAPVGLLIAMLLTEMWSLPRMVGQLFGISYSTLAKALAWPVVVGLPWFGMTVLLRRVWPTSSNQLIAWLLLVGELGTYAAGYLTLWWSLMLSSNQRVEWRGRTADVWRHFILRSGATQV